MNEKRYALALTLALTGCNPENANVPPDESASTSAAATGATNTDSGKPQYRPGQFTLDTGDEAVLHYFDESERSRNSSLILDEQMARLGRGRSEDDPKRRRLVERKELMGSAIDVKKTATHAGNLVGETTQVTKTGEGSYAIKFKTWVTEPEIAIDLAGVPNEQTIEPNPDRLPGVWKYTATATKGEIKRTAEWVDLSAYADVLDVIQKAGQRTYDRYCQETPARARDAVDITAAEYSPLGEARRDPM